MRVGPVSCSGFQHGSLVHALSSRKVPVTLIGIPGAHHSPQDPVHRELYYRAIDDWVAARLGLRWFEKPLG